VSRRARLALFAVAAGGFGTVLVISLTGLPDFGDYHGVYGLVLTGIGVSARHATDLVTAVNFDFRAFDTLGEEFILFGSVLGVVLILRELRDERQEPAQAQADEHQLEGPSSALRAFALLAIPLIITVGAYIVVHGQLTPGGGFQGGIVLAAGPLAVFLAGRYLRMKVVAPHIVIELGDALGAMGYALVGIGGLVFTGTFLKNFIALGVPGHLLSAGHMPIVSLTVGIEVAGAFLIAWSEFLDQVLIVQSDRDS
jgi:multicomponent Na+:H+ antiporter subunit B